ncbi:MAG: hypothetical protein JXR70_10275 [Spirochaetales bacterium]|nr:hypothetical protein [Spirochaetales bacterium]
MNIKTQKTRLPVIIVLGSPFLLILIDLWFDRGSFTGYLGNIPALPVYAALALVAYLSLLFLNPVLEPQKEEQVKQSRPFRFNDIFSVFWVITFFILYCIVLDLLYKLPSNLNTAMPEALILYPVLAIAVEIIFHIIPVALLLFIRKLILSPNREKKPLSWISFFLWALPALIIEPLYQINLPFQNNYHWTLTAFTLFFSFLFNLTGLRLLYTKGPVPMILFRLFYYIGWHMLWNLLR